MEKWFWTIFPDHKRLAEKHLSKKKEDSFTKDYYRPIINWANFPLIAKVFEKVINSQVYTYMQQ